VSESAGGGHASFRRTPADVKEKEAIMSYHYRNVPVFSTIEMSPGFDFMLARKRGRAPLLKRLVSRDGWELEEGCALESGKGAR
jgi:hypothetical protein